MALPTVTADRSASLRIELEKAIEHHGRMARTNYRFALFLMAIALTASGVAGVGGIFLGLNGQIAGGVALLPGIIALIATVLKPDGRANWHYRRRDGLYALRRRLLYQLPEAPSADQVAAIASGWSALDEKGSKEWEDNFSLNWSPFTSQASQRPNER